MPSPSDAERVAYCGAKSIEGQIATTRKGIAQATRELDDPRTKAGRALVLSERLRLLRSDLADWYRERLELQEAAGSLYMDAAAMKAYATHLVAVLTRLADEPIPLKAEDQAHEEAILSELMYDDLIEVES